MIGKIDLQEVGKRIQFYRIQKGLTQEKLSELAGTSQKHLSSIEMGNHNIKLETIVAIATGLGVSVDMLIADYNDSTNESTLKVILDEIRGMSSKQLEMLREQIKIIKKYEK